MRMDKCAFALKMQGVTKEEGIKEILALLESVGYGREAVRVTQVKKGNGNGVYHEVTATSDDVVVKWWAGRGGKKGGTLMVDGEKEPFEAVLEKIMWAAKEWQDEHRKGKIIVSDDKLRVPQVRKRMYIVAGSHVGGGGVRSTKIFNGLENEQEWLVWKKAGGIAMGFLDLAEARRWQRVRAAVEGWEVVVQDWPVRMGTVRSNEGDDVLGRRMRSDDQMRGMMEREGGMYEYDERAERATVEDLEAVEGMGLRDLVGRQAGRVGQARQVATTTTTTTTTHNTQDGEVSMMTRWGGDGSFDGVDEKEQERDRELIARFERLSPARLDFLTPLRNRDRERLEKQIRVEEDRKALSEIEALLNPDGIYTSTTTTSGVSRKP